MPGIYRIPCECGRVCTGQTDSSMGTRLKEHQQHIRIEHPDKSAITECSINFGHCIQFHVTSILTTKTRYMDCIVREAIEIELHPNNMNREAGFVLYASSRNFQEMTSDPPHYMAIHSSSFFKAIESSCSEATQCLLIL
jgi:hypothetical protein